MAQEREENPGNFPAVLNPARVAALSRLGLLDTPAEEAFDRLGNLAAKLTHAPVALVSLVDDHRQYFKSSVGLPEPWNTWRNTPLSHSFCKHVVASDQPLILTDARTHPLFCENLAIRDIGVVAYLGIPLRTSGGHVLGSFCVIDSKPREWTVDEVETITVLAECVMTEIELRSEARLRKKAEDELSRANEALRSFGTTLAHDLRAPLRHISSFTNMLREHLGRDVTGDIRFCLNAISESATAANSMIQGISTLSHVTRAEIEGEVVDLSDLARRVIAEIQGIKPGKVEVVIQEGLAACVDPDLAWVLLENLLGNAWKFSARKANPRIEFGSEQIRDETVFYIRDNGVGFDEAEGGRLFTVFERLSTASGFPGSGIGLQTVKRIVERHGGRVWGHSKPGQGATFFFTFPAASCRRAVPQFELVEAGENEG